MRSPQACDDAQDEKHKEIDVKEAHVEGKVSTNTVGQSPGVE